MANLYIESIKIKSSLTLGEQAAALDNIKKAFFHNYRTYFNLNIDDHDYTDITIDMIAEGFEKFVYKLHSKRLRAEVLPVEITEVTTE